MEAAAVFAGAAGLSLWLVARLRALCLRRGWLDRPNARSAHTSATPRLGGLAPVLLVSAGVLALAAQRAAEPGPSASAVRFTALALLGLALAALGLADDLRPLPAAARLLAQVLAACGVVALWGVPSHLVWGPNLVLEWGRLAPVWGVLWVVACINACNFMDGCDGLLGLQAVLAGLGWWLLGTLHGEALPQMVGLLLAGSALGFLRHNWSPASIFMGDCGSAFVGFWLGALPLASPGAEQRWGAAALLLWPCLFDTGLTLLRRTWRREALFEAHRGHLYQRLARSGVGAAALASLYGLLGALGVGLAVAQALASASAAVAACTFAVPALAGAALYAAVRHRERA